MLKETIVAYCPPGDLVAEEEEHAPLPRHASLQHRSSVADLLDRVVKTLLQSSSTTQASHAGGYYAARGDDPRRNVLSLGCRIAGPQATSELLSVQGVACAFPNTTVNVVRSPPWEQLASRIGDDLMFALLRQHALLQRLPNRCFMQLTGRPVPDLCRQQGLTAGTLTAFTPRISTVGTDGRQNIFDLPETPRSNNASVQHRNIQASSLPVGISTVSAIEGDRQASSTVDKRPSKVAVHNQPRAGGAKRSDQRSSTVLLPHHRIFYSSAFVRKAGFPRGHYLHPARFTPSSTPRASKSTDGSDAESIKAARRLLFDLLCSSERCPRRSLGRAGVHGVSTGTPSLQGIVAGPMDVGRTGKGGRGGGRASSERGRKLPKRLRKAVPLFAEMIARAHLCNFGRLLEAHCLLPKAFRRLKTPRHAVERKNPHGAERNTPTAPPVSRGRDMFMAQDGAPNGTASLPVFSLTSAAKREGGTGQGLEGVEADDVERVSIVKEICSWPPGAYTSQSSYDVRAHTQDGESVDRAPAACAAKRRRPLDDDASAVGERRSDGESEQSDFDATPASEEDDAASDATMIDSGAEVDAQENLEDSPALGATTENVGPRARANAAAQGSRFGLDPDKSFVDMATERRRVANFMCQACHRIFPTDLWGSKRNMVLLAKAVERFIGLRRHESMSVQEVTTGMRTSDFRWMALEHDDQKVTQGARRKRGRGSNRCPPSELAKRAQLLEALVLWAFSDIVVPLLRSHFYVTECEVSSQEVFFFRKPVWANFRAASVGHLTTRQYREITDTTEEALQDEKTRLQRPRQSCTQDTSPMLECRSRSGASGGHGGNAAMGSVRAFPASIVRLVPKENGVRAIMNLSKRSWVERDRVQWVKGVPLPAPRTALSIQRSSSNASVQTNGVAASKEATRASSRGGRVLPGEGGLGATKDEGQRKRRKLEAAQGTRTNGGARVLLPSTNMQLSNAFHVLKHEYLNKPSLAGAGVFGLDDVFGRIKPFVSRNLRPLYSTPGASPRQPGRGNDAAARQTGPRPRPIEEDGSSDERGPSPWRNVRAATVEANDGRFDATGEAVQTKKGAGDSRGRPREPPAGRQRERLPALFFASVDIKHCYDTIDQAKLLDIIRPLIASEDYVIQKYAKTHPYKAMARVQVSHVKDAVAMGDVRQFRTRCDELADESFDAIFTDQVVYGIVSRDEVLDMIEEHVRNAVVEVPAAGGSGRGAFFRQAVGIPQGSVLSGLLCNFFFGHIEEKLLGEILTTPVHPAREFNAPVTITSGENGCSSLSARGNKTYPAGPHGHGRDLSLCPTIDEETGCAEMDKMIWSRARGKLGEAFCSGATKVHLLENGYGGCPVERVRGDSTDALRGGRPQHRRKETCRAEHCLGNSLRRGSDVDKRDSTSKSQSRLFPDPEGDCTLLRQVDDFLLVSTSKRKAEAFVRIMHDQVKTGEWGFGVHEGKTAVNFDMSVDGDPGTQYLQRVRKIDGKMFPWCGLRFNTQTCEVMANYSRYSHSSISDSVTVESHRAGACLMAKMKRFLSPKCHALMLDEGELGINSRHTVLLNVYEMFLVCAAKTAASALRLPRGPAGNSSLLSQGAQETTGYAYNLIQRCSNKRRGDFGTSKGVRCVCKVNRFEVTWLGLYAFQQVFSVYSAKRKGFARPTSDVADALLGVEGGEKRRETSHGIGGGAYRSTAEKSKEGRRVEAVARLRRIVRKSDALRLLHTLTTDAAEKADAGK